MTGKPMQARPQRTEQIRAMFADPARIAGALDGMPVPTAITDWLGRLHTLIGVPFGYLVPAEQMLPPESIRFFRLDEAWVEALIDGAFSLGRDLTLDQSASLGAAVDRIVVGPVMALSRAAAPVHRRSARRRRELRAAAPPVLRLLAPSIEAPSIAASSIETSSIETGSPAWTGFLLRSSVVAAYPGLGVTVFSADDTETPLEVKRLDRLGPDSDTLFCLVVGDASTIEVHEAPEQLHYGLDSYDVPESGEPTASKAFHAFDRAADGTVTFRTDGDGKPVILLVDLSSSLRPTSPRVVDLTSAGATLGSRNGTGPLDSAQLGFALTAGVGMVSFVRRPTPEQPA